MVPRAVELLQQALLLVLWLSLPALAAGAAVGVVVGIVGSATQVNDPTVAHLPRVLAVAVVILALGGAGASAMVHFTHALWRAIPTLVR